MNNCLNCLYFVEVDKDKYCNRKALETRQIIAINNPELECPCHSLNYKEESRSGFSSLDSKHSYDVCQHCNRFVKDSSNIKIANKLRVCKICYDKYFC
jgi:hypothetical protein